MGDRAQPPPLKRKIFLSLNSQMLQNWPCTTPLFICPFANKKLPLTPLPESNVKLWIRFQYLRFPTVMLLSFCKNVIAIQGYRNYSVLHKCFKSIFLQQFLYYINFFYWRFGHGIKKKQEWLAEQDRHNISSSISIDDLLFRVYVLVPQTAFYF